jgi:hypothetical protein
MFPIDNNSIYLRKRVSDEVKTQLSVRLGRDVACMNTPDVHSHPNLAAERYVLISELLKITSMQHGDNSQILDCFGNAAEFNRRNSNRVWSCMPLITASDSTRINSAISRGLENFCTCDPLNCYHCEDVSVALFVQSVQYVTPQYLAEIIGKVDDHVAYSIVHRYDGVAGNFYKDEMHWHRNTANSVICSMEGGRTEYSHSACDWIDEPQLTSLGELVSCNVVTVGQTTLYRHFLRYPLPRNNLQGILEWSPSSISGNIDGLYALPQTFTGSVELTHALSLYKMPINKFKMVSNVIIFVGDECEDIVISKPILADGTTWMLAKPRDPTTYRQLMSYLIGKYRGIANLPSDKLPRATLATAVLIMIASTIELGLLVNLLYDQQTIFGLYNKTLQFEPPNSFQMSTITACGASVGVTCTASYFWPTQLVSTSTTSSLALVHTANMSNVLSLSGHGLLIGAAGSGFVIPLIPLIWSVFSTGLTVKWIYDWTQRHERVPIRPSIVPPGEIFSISTLVPMPKIHCTRRMKPINLNATNIIIGPDIKPPSEKPLLSLEGIGFSEIIPTYYDGDQEALLVGVSNRLMGETPSPVPGVWEELSLMYNSTNQQRLYIQDGKTLFSNLDAVKRWISIFPLHKQERLLVAYDDVVRNNYKLTKKEMNVDLFVKREKQLALSITAGQIPSQTHDLKAPRVITTMTDKAAVILGPIAQQASLLRNKAIMRDPVKTVCPRYCSGEIMGEWFSSAVEALGGYGAVIALDGDGSSFDMHTKHEAMKAVRDTLFRPKKFEIDEVKSIKCSPFMSRLGNGRGLKVLIGDQRCTGEADTDVGNTILTEMIIVYGLDRGSALFRSKNANPNSGMGKYYKMAACGDDQFILVNKEWFEVRFEVKDDLMKHQLQSDEFRENCLRLGYKHTLNIGDDAFDNEYCSKRWYPGPDGPLLGGKIGRTLARAGWFLDVLQEQTLYSASVSQLQDNYHVPFLREYFTKVVFLCKKQKLLPGGKPQVHSIHMAQRHEYDQSTWDFITHKYGLVKQDLVEFERKLSLVNSLPVIIDWEHIVGCLDVDGA